MLEADEMKEFFEKCRRAGNGVKSALAVRTPRGVEQFDMDEENQCGGGLLAGLALEQATDEGQISQDGNLVVYVLDGVLHESSDDDGGAVEHGELGVRPLHAENGHENAVRSDDGGHGISQNVGARGGDGAAVVDETIEIAERGIEGDIDEAFLANIEARRKASMASREESQGMVDLNLNVAEQNLVQ